jgi:orotidine-5'-phosphate decarboxylase
MTMTGTHSPAHVIAPRDRVIVALDVPDLAGLNTFLDRLDGRPAFYKIGLELFIAEGERAVEAVQKRNGRLFLDLKLHDIPATVAGAARAVARLRPAILTVHAAGGAAMIRAAAEAAPDTSIAAVTVLTSLGDADLAATGMTGTARDVCRRLAVLAVSAGARGLVCSPHEVADVRAEVGPGITLITPGIRPAGAEAQDQARIATPEAALSAGADLLVIGRPITSAPDPGAAAAAVRSALRRLAAAPG